jgi:hypothetical protein
LRRSEGGTTARLHIRIGEWARVLEETAHPLGADDSSVTPFARTYRDGLRLYARAA